MSETSQSVGRIAVLTAFTLLFAAAWSSDAPHSSRPAPVFASTRRESGGALEAVGRGAIVDGLNHRRLSVSLTFSARTNGQLLSLAPVRETPRLESAALFSGTPALLGRSTPPISAADDALVTASPPAAETR